MIADKVVMLLTIDVDENEQINYEEIIHNGFRLWIYAYRDDVGKEMKIYRSDKAWRISFFGLI